MDGQLKAGTFLTSESSNKYKVNALLGAGGQGEVYDVECGGKHYALKWYFKHMATKSQKEILDNLITRGAPDDSFLWPQDLIFKGYGESFGYIMPLRPKNFKSIVDKRENIVAGCTQNHVVKLEKFVGDFHPVVTVFDVFENAFELFYVIVRAIFCRQISTFALVDAPEFHYGIDGFFVESAAVEVYD